MRLGEMSMSKTGGITYLVPVMNGERYLEQSVRSIINQDFPGPYEVVISVSQSSDTTEHIAQQLQEEFSDRIIIVHNVFGDTANALNLAREKGAFDTIIRVDAHSEIPSNYSSIAFDTMRETGAANVGGLMQAQGETSFQRAVAYGYNNRIGLGGGAFHLGGKAGPADSVYLGCFQKSWLDRVGGFDPKWVRGQDWELNKRLREAGGTVWFDPRLKVTYYPRDNWPALAKQFFNTGIWRGALTREAPGQSAIRYWIPPLLVVSTIFWLPVTLYLLVIAFAAMNAGDLKPATRLWLMIVMPTMHYAWGVGFWKGLMSKKLQNSFVR